MKNFKTYITEKLNAKDRLEYIIAKLFGDAATTEKSVKEYKKFVDKYSEGKCGLAIKRTKEILNTLDNCINADMPLMGYKGDTIRECFNKGRLASNLPLDDKEQPFIVIYNKKNPSKYVLDYESIWFLSSKREDGTRPLHGNYSNWEGGLTKEDDPDHGYTYADRVVYTYIPLALNPKEEIEKWLDKFIYRFFTQQFKRNCVPDGVKIGTVSLSPRGDFNIFFAALISLSCSEPHSGHIHILILRFLVLLLR